MADPHAVLAAEARELREELDRLNAVVDAMADGVLVTDSRGRVVRCNAALRRMLGLAAPPSAPGSMAACQMQDDALKEIIGGLLAGGREAGEVVARDFWANGLHLRALAAPWFGPDRRVGGTVTVFQDVTAFKELDDLKNDCVRLVSHELRSPLVAIQQQQALILGGFTGALTEKQRDLVARSQAKIDGLLEMINDLLDLARMEAGYRPLEPAPLDAGPLLAELVELLTARAAAGGLTLRLAAPPALPSILADRAALEQVFTNLLHNAINYSPDGGEIIITATLRGGGLEVAVQDPGVGLEPGEIPHIFEKFYRAKNPRTRQVIGTGLGLTLVKALVEAHGGTVRVDSRLGAGTTFRVTLPLATGAPDAEARS